jgi:hypothetical protein
VDKTAFNNCFDDIQGRILFIYGGLGNFMDNGFGYDTEHVDLFRFPETSVLRRSDWYSLGMKSCP